MRERTKWIFYVILALPLAGLVNGALTNQLGANPAETLNKNLGDLTLYLFLLNLYWGSFEALINNRMLKPWFALRRTIGVATFLYACLHFASYFLREGDFEVAFKQLVEKPYLIFGFASLVVMLPLALTSNNWAVRKLRFPKWKALHRAVYFAFFLISIHIFLIEKRSWLTNKYNTLTDDRGSRRQILSRDMEAPKVSARIPEKGLVPIFSLRPRSSLELDCKTFTKGFV